jgi:hypothetical protein
MQYGICSLSMVPVYESPDEASGMVTQLLYGEVFKVLESRKRWSRVRAHLDQSEGWIRNLQWRSIEEADYKDLADGLACGCACDLISHITTEEGLLLPVSLGASIGGTSIMNHQHEGEVFPEKHKKEELVQTALMFLNSPELKGGRSPFGIDAAGLSQLVYKTQGILLKHQPQEQALQGTALSFIEESEAGDLAFFDGPDGVINHVGIIMGDNYLVHAYGKVRIDRLDHTGIFNTEVRNYTHSLRVIVRVL